MVRRFAEPVYVRQAEQQPSGVPEAFVWRDRLYVVREVLDHWREGTAWWTTDAARAVHGDLRSTDPRSTDPRADLEAEALSPVSGQRDDPAAAAARSAARGRERQVWRVEASPGMAHAHGVYDLCHDVVADPDRPAGHSQEPAPELSGRDTWQLLRVTD